MGACDYGQTKREKQKNKKPLHKRSVIFLN